MYPVNKSFAGYTYGYNRPVFANRVHDILTSVMFARDLGKAKTIHLVGWEGAGPWVAAARALCGDAVARTAIDLNQLRFDKITDVTDDSLLPGASSTAACRRSWRLCRPASCSPTTTPGPAAGS